MKESESRDRVISENRTESGEFVPKTEQLAFTIDPDVQAVLEFMQRSVPSFKLLGIAESMPEMARLLWSRYPQEPVVAVSLEAKPLLLNTACETQLAATV